MWIIFDLDDTLIDTTGSIAPFKLERALKKMIESGLEISDFSKAKFSLTSLNKKCLNSEDTILLFLETHQYDKKFLPIAVHEIYYSPLPSNFSVKLTPNAKKILYSLKKTCSFCLVTKGIHELQMDKLEKAGIDKSIFSNIITTKLRDKKPHYTKILIENHLTPEKVVVVGDHIQRDLKPAKELGLTTIHMKWGRGLYSEDHWGLVDYEICDLTELGKTLHRIQLLHGIKT